MTDFYPLGDPPPEAPADVTPFATAADLSVRLGRPLTDAEAMMADALLMSTTGLIIEAAGKSDAWAAVLDPVPAVLRVVCLEAVVRVISNPSGLASSQEQIGSYQYTQSHRRDAPTGLVLTEAEERLVRRAATGRTSGSARVSSIADDLCIRPEIQCPSS